MRSGVRGACCAGLLALAPSMFATHASAQPASCVVERKPYVNAGRADATMVVEEGSPCQFRFRFGGTNPPDSWKLVESPKSGKITFNADVAEYQPTAGFTGEDRFVIHMFGTAPNCGSRCTRNGEYQVTVTVKPKAP